MTPKKLGFVGIGKMGRPMAERLIEAGHALVLFDVAASAITPLLRSDVTAASSVQHVGDQAETVLVSVPTPEIVLQVCRDLARGAKTKRVIDLSTTGPNMSAQVADELASLDIALIDCPVSGGVAGARSGKLALMAAASEADITALLPVLEVFGRVFHVGVRPGMGQMMKVTNNLMSAAALAIAAEGVAMAAKFGLDPATVVEVLNAGSGRNSATLDKFPRQILTGTFDAGFTIGLMLKDVRLCLGQVAAMDMQSPAAEIIGAIWEKAASELGGEQDFTHVVKLAERAACVELRSSYASR